MVACAVRGVPPFRVAVTVSVPVPALDPAVNVVVAPVVGLAPPRLELTDQTRVSPEEGHGEGLQTAVAVKVAVPPVATVAEVGESETDEIVGELPAGRTCRLVPPVVEALPSVATTETATTPGADPAVKVTELPVVGATVPSVLLSDHANVTPPGQGAGEQTPEAVRASVVPKVTEEEAAETETPVRTVVEMVTVAKAVTCFEPTDALT